MNDTKMEKEICKHETLNDALKELKDFEGVIDGLLIKINGEDYPICEESKSDVKVKITLSDILNQAPGRIRTSINNIKETLIKIEKELF